MSYKNTVIQINKDNDKVIDIIRSTQSLFKNFKPSDRKNIFVDSICTKSDKVIADYITKKLHDIFPKDSILAEDGLGIDIPDSNITWVLDPIDGTIPYMAYVPSYMVSLYRVIDNKVSDAYTYDPTQDLIYTAGLIKSANCNAMPIRVSNKKSLSGATVAISGHGLDRLPWIYDALKTKGAYILPQEGLVFRSMLVASGHIDATIQPTFKQYESGSIMLIVNKAGGKVLDSNNLKPKLFTTNKDVIISNYYLNKEIQKLFKEYSN